MISIRTLATKYPIPPPIAAPIKTLRLLSILCLLVQDFLLLFRQPGQALRENMAHFLRFGSSPNPLNTLDLAFLVDKNCWPVEHIIKLSNPGQCVVNLKRICVCKLNHCGSPSRNTDYHRHSHPGLCLAAQISSRIPPLEVKQASSARQRQSR